MCSRVRDESSRSIGIWSRIGGQNEQPKSADTPQVVFTSPRPLRQWLGICWFSMAQQSRHLPGEGKKGQISQVLSVSSHLGSY